MRPSQFVCIGQSIDDIQCDFPHVPVADGSACASVELNILIQVSVQELGLDEEFLRGVRLDPSVLDLDDIRVMRSSNSINTVQIKAYRGIWNDGFKGRVLRKSVICRRDTTWHT